MISSRASSAQHALLCWPETAPEEFRHNSIERRRTPRLEARQQASGPTTSDGTEPSFGRDIVGRRRIAVTFTEYGWSKQASGAMTFDGNEFRRNIVGRRRSSVGWKRGEQGGATTSDGTEFRRNIVGRRRPLSLYGSGRASLLRRPMKMGFGIYRRTSWRTVPPPGMNLGYCDGLA